MITISKEGVLKEPVGRLRRCLVFFLECDYKEFDYKGYDFRKLKFRESYFIMFGITRKY